MIQAFYSEIGERSAAYALLRYAVRELFAVPCPETARDGNGKPFFPSRPDIFFSLSHTRTHVMACVSDAPCGCDIETLRPVRPSLISYVCSPEELEQFSFFELWTLKESFFKFYGALPQPFWTSRFYRSGTEIRPLSHPRSSPPRLAVYDLGTAAAALCTPLPPPAALTPISPDFLK